MIPVDVSSTTPDLRCTSTADLHLSYTKETVNEDFVYLSGYLYGTIKVRFEKEHIFK